MDTQFSIRRLIFGRYSLSLGVSAVITTGLFVIMQLAVNSEDTEIPTYTPSAPIGLVKLDRKEPEPEQKKLKPPPKVEPPPVFKPRVASLSLDPQSGFGPLIPPDNTIVVTPSDNYADGELMPYLTVAPEYPDSAARRGIEGWVIVEFTVDTLGRVIEPMVIDAHPIGVFNRSALKAVQRYKYRPRVIHGEATRVQGVRQRIVFNLAST